MQPTPTKKLETSSLNSIYLSDHTENKDNLEEVVDHSNLSHFHNLYYQQHQSKWNQLFPPLQQQDDLNLRLNFLHELTLLVQLPSFVVDME